jgi:uncharacterized membrane protein
MRTRGLIFFMPLLGMAIGAPDAGRRGSRVRARARGDRDKVLPEISKYGGHVIQSSLSNE